MLHRYSWIGILAEFFVSFDSWIRILDGFFVPFGSWMGILGRSFISFGSWMRILDRSFVSFGSRIRIPAGFLILKARPKSDLYKDGLIFYRGNVTLYEFGYVIASRNSSSFLSLMKEKKKKKIKAMIAIYFCLVHVVNGRCLVRLGEGRVILTWFLLLRARSKSDLYKDRLIFYRNSAALHGFGHVVASRNGSSFLSLMKEKKQKKIKAMIAIYFCLVHVIHGRCLVRLGEGRAILTEFLLLRVRHKSGLYKNGLIFYRGNAALHGFGYVVASRNGSSFLSLMKEKKQKKIKAMIAICFYLVHVVNGRYFVHLEDGNSILAGFLLLRVLPKSGLYKNRLIFYRDSAAFYEFGYVIAPRKDSSFLSLMKEKNQKKIKAMIAIYFFLIHVVNGQCLVRLGEGRIILAEF